MRKTWILTLGASLVLMTAGCGSDDESGNGGTQPQAEVGGEIFMVQLNEQNGSGESGTAELRGEGSQTVVEISLDGAPATAQPAHIHKGTCENLDPAPAYPLEDVVGGKSTSTESVKLANLRDGEYAINVHKSAAAVETYVACGNVAPATAARWGAARATRIFVWPPRGRSSCISRVIPPQTS